MFVDFFFFTNFSLVHFLPSFPSLWWASPTQHTSPSTILQLKPHINIRLVHALPLTIQAHASALALILWLPPSATVYLLPVSLSRANSP